MTQDVKAQHTPGPHRCSDGECPYIGQASPKSCGCHKSDEQMLKWAYANLVEALDKAATRFEHCADMIAGSFDASGTLRAERTIKAKHYALEARAAIARATGEQP